jgi:hypothetical protein
MLTNMWAFLRPFGGKAAKPATTDFGDVNESDIQKPRRIPPHQKYRLMSAEDRWRANAGSRPPSERDNAASSGSRLAG